MNSLRFTKLSILLFSLFSCTQPKAAPCPDEATATASTGTAIAAPVDVEYQQADSLEVLELLSDTELCRNIDYAHHFLGRPYVAYTLDGYYRDGARPEDEHLVVNLREFDCLTLLETCNALAMTRAQLEAAKADASHSERASRNEGTGGLDPWTLYCRNLESLRYFGGHEDGYLSRIHYLSMSAAEHLSRGTFEEVVLPESITKPRTTNICYMTQHPQSYYALKNNPDLIDPLAKLEQRYSGQKMRFLPQENCGLPRQATDEAKADLSAIEDGDLLYIVTTKSGLDYSHQGFAYWAKDPSADSGHPQRLHMLHASSAKKHVIEDPLPLDAYLKGISTNAGVRIFRLKK